MKRALRRLVANLLTGSIGRLVAFVIDVAVAAAAHAAARLRGRRTAL